MSNITVLSESDVASLLGFSIKTLRNWRTVGQGPAYIKVGRTVLYLPDDITAFLIAHRRSADGCAVTPAPSNDPTPVKRGRGRPRIARG